MKPTELELETRGIYRFARDTFEAINDLDPLEADRRARDAALEYKRRKRIGRESAALDLRTVGGLYSFASRYNDRRMANTPE